jgi:hypothetical protein
MTNQSVREAIEVLSNIVRGINQGHHDLTEIDKKSIIVLLTIAQQFLDRQEGWLEEIEQPGTHSITDQHLPYKIQAANEMRSLCLLARNAEIAKARKEIEGMLRKSNTDCECFNCKLIDKNNEFVLRVLSLPIFKEVK